MTAIAVTIAGSDSGGGAGIQADLKTFSALGVYGASVIAALTAQNTKGVTGIHDVPPAFVTAQIDAVFSDLAVNAVKIGMLSHPDVIAAVADGLDKYKQERDGARSGDGRGLRRPAAGAGSDRGAAQCADPEGDGDHAQSAGSRGACSKPRWRRPKARCRRRAKGCSRSAPRRC